MKLNFNINITTLLCIAGAIVLFLLWRNESSESARWENNYDISISDHKQFVSEMDGIIVTYRESVTLTNQELKKALKGDSIQRELVKKYRKLAESATIITEWKHDVITVAVPIFITRDTTIKHSDKCFSVDLSLSNGKLTLQDMRVPNRQDIVSGRRKTGLFSSEYSMDIRNSNECIITSGMNSYKVIDKPKWYEHPFVWGAAGLVGGFYLNSRIK